MNPADARQLGISDGDRVRMCSPRGSVETCVRIQPDIPRGLTFTTFHFPELVDVNQLTNPEWDLRSGTAEFKAAAVRIERIASTPVNNPVPDVDPATEFADG